MSDWAKCHWGMGGKGVSRFDWDEGGVIGKFEFLGRALIGTKREKSVGSDQRLFEGWPECA